MDFPNFLNAFTVTHELENGEVPEQLQKGLRPDLATVIEQLGGKTFDHGLYRVYPAQSLVQATLRVWSLVPWLKGRSICFASDWLGNQFVQPLVPSESGEYEVLLIESCVGKALEIPAGVIAFHEEILPAHEDNNALTQALRVDWLKVDSDPVGPTECIGYRVPPFLGGSDEVSNLERSDMDVYLHLMAQLVVQTGGASADDS